MKYLYNSWWHMPSIYRSIKVNIFEYICLFLFPFIDWYPTLLHGCVYRRLQENLISWVFFFSQLLVWKMIQQNLRALTCLIKHARLKHHNKLFPDLINQHGVCANLTKVKRDWFTSINILVAAENTNMQFPCLQLPLKEIYHPVFGNLCWPAVIYMITYGTF